MDTGRKSRSTSETPTKYDMTPELEHSIKLRVHELFDECGKEHGNDLDQWLQSEAKPPAERAKKIA